MSSHRSVGKNDVGIGDEHGPDAFAADGDDVVCREELPPGDVDVACHAGEVSYVYFCADDRDAAALIEVSIFHIGYDEEIV